MYLINISALLSLLQDKPKGQRLYEAFEGNWDKLTDNQIIEVKTILLEEFKNIEMELRIITSEREIC